MPKSTSFVLALSPPVKAVMVSVVMVFGDRRMDFENSRVVMVFYVVDEGSVHHFTQKVKHKMRKKMKFFQVVTVNIRRGMGLQFSGLYIFPTPYTQTNIRIVTTTSSRFSSAFTPAPIFSRYVLYTKFSIMERMRSFTKQRL